MLTGHTIVKRLLIAFAAVNTLKKKIKCIKVEKSSIKKVLHTIMTDIPFPSLSFEKLQHAFSNANIKVQLKFIHGHIFKKNYNNNPKLYKELLQHEGKL